MSSDGAQKLPPSFQTTVENWVFYVSANWALKNNVEDAKRMNFIFQTDPHFASQVSDYEEPNVLL